MYITTKITDDFGNLISVPFKSLCNFIYSTNTYGGVDKDFCLFDADI